MHCPLRLGTAVLQSLYYMDGTCHLEVKKMREMFLNITQVTIWCAQSAEVGFCSSAIPVLSRLCIAAIFEFDSLPVPASYCSLLLVSALMAGLAVCGIC